MSIEQIFASKQISYVILPGCHPEC